MNRRDALTQSRTILAQHGVPDAFLEGEILLRHVLRLDRARLFTALEEPISPAQSDALQNLVQRRLRGEPSAYITGHKEFYGLDFTINHDVLIPRPETEMLVDEAINLCIRDSCRTTADIGTGSGAIAIALAVNLPSVSIIAADVSAGALKIAAANAFRYQTGERIAFVQGSLLEPLPHPVDIIIANLPYVKKTDLPAGGFEPLLALDGGKDGLDQIRALAPQVSGKLNSGGHLLLEIGLGQAEAVQEILRRYLPGSPMKVYPDLAGITRMISLRLTSQL